jgi:arsenate reductase-like glutaredoxin family protein
VLARAGVAFTERDLRKEPLSEEEIRTLLHGRPASDFYATRSPRNRALGVDPKPLNDDEMIALMAREPTLIRRPIVAVGQTGEVIPGATRKQLAAMVER